MMTIPDDIQIGTRIQVDRDRATVRFIGAVEGTKGEWLGVEWDEPTRGKHDGTHKGVKYFECRYPSSGSFIRFQPNKVLLGQTFMQALKDKYLAEQEENSVAYDKVADRGEVYLGGNKQIVVETYGFEKVQRTMRQLERLTVVGLAEMLISSAGSPEEISKANLAIEDLDLSRNLISSWEELEKIALQLPKLTILRLNQSRLISPQQPLQLRYLQTLVLNKTLISWKDVEILAPGLPQLEDLQLGGNEIKSLSSIQWERLKCLNLEENLIEDWGEVAKLQSLSNLQILFLNGNKIKSIRKEGVFDNLEYLRIDGNSIKDWDSINMLNHYPKLTKLRCKNNPVFEGLDKEMEASQVVGRIGNLTVVNGNTLTSRERIDLERYYLMMCTKDGTTHQAISSIHPRYQELCKQHGEPDLETQAQKATSALNDRLIEIMISLRPLEENEVSTISKREQLPPITKSVSKRFLPTMTIRSIKHLIQKLLKVPASKQTLYLTQIIGDSLMIMDISDDLRDLKYYGMKQGDEIIVVEK
ncbi:hypothetical protein AB4K20DRAFT_1890136 [Rhizopus microsporus]|uniref:Tubulin-folding cofactor E n=2 Tax=Rhizopus TaxID=4842 RepID=A0A1X0SDR6_RHIZD|nr:hypothetical protein BCV71DRAFT_124863 [Rhizopus microsporus]